MEGIAMSVSWCGEDHAGYAKATYAKPIGADTYGLIYRPLCGKHALYVKHDKNPWGPIVTIKSLYE
jgi:hypothetical protein